MLIAVVAVAAAGVAVVVVVVVVVDFASEAVVILENYSIVEVTIVGKIADCFLEFVEVIGFVVAVSITVAMIEVKALADMMVAVIGSADCDFVGFAQAGFEFADAALADSVPVAFVVVAV